MTPANKARKNLTKKGVKLKVAPAKKQKFGAFKQFSTKTQKLFSIEEQIKREKAKNMKLKKKQELFNLQSQNRKISSKIKPTSQADPFKDFFKN